MTPAELFESHRWIATNCASRYRSKVCGALDVDDLIQAGLVGLWQAARRYDPEYGVKFSTYAFRRVRGAIVDELRVAMPGTRGQLENHGLAMVYSLNERIDERLGEVVSVVDEPGYAEVEDVDEAHGLWALSGQLPERLRLVLWLRYAEDLPLCEIGGMLGFTESRACQLVRAAEDGLRTLAA